MNFINKILILGFPGSYKLKQMELIYKNFDYTVIEAVDGTNFMQALGFPAGALRR